MKLEFANKILKNELYQSELKRLSVLEKDRKFCRHDTEHFLTMARITMIMCCERGVAADPDTVYSAALLHDIGRAVEYSEGVPHDIAGKEIAERILAETGCSDDMRADIVRLVASHRHRGSSDDSLESIFYVADKRSRACFDCPAREECNWPPEKMNLEIEV